MACFGQFALGRPDVPAAANLKERVEGVRDALKGSKWTEVSGSPTYCNDDLALAVQQMQDLKTANVWILRPSCRLAAGPCSFPRPTRAS